MKVSDDMKTLPQELTPIDSSSTMAMAHRALPLFRNKKINSQETRTIPLT
jgi:hypothetical protein